LRYNWNVGGSWFKPTHAAWTMSIIFDITRRVFGPTEQPKSATFMHFGEECLYSLLIASSSMVLALSIIVLYNKIKVDQYTIKR